MGESSPLNVRSSLPNETLASSSNSFGIYAFAFQQSMNQLKVSPSSGNKNSHQTTNCHTGGCHQAHQYFSRTQFPALDHSQTSDFDYKQYRPQNGLDISDSDNIRMNGYGNEGEGSNSRVTTAERLKIALRRLNSLPLRSCPTFHENKTPEQCLSTHDVYRLQKSVSFSSDYKMSCNSSTSTSHPDDYTTAVSNQDLSLVHGLVMGHSMSSEHTLLTSMAVTSTARVASVRQSMARISTPITSNSLLPHYVSDHCQSSLPTASTRSSVPSSASTSTTAHGEESMNGCPSPQVSDLGSEDTHASVSQHTFLQSYGSLTPWTSTLTTPGYTPLPTPAPDAMPIPMEQVNQDYMLRMPSPFHETSPQSWHAKPNQNYSHLKPRLSVESYSETISNNKIKTRSSSTSIHAHRPKLTPNKEYQFRRTADALHKSGLWEVAMKTGSLMKRNRELQKELEEFRSDAVAFLKSVIKNPQNRGIIKNILKTALISNSGSQNDTSVMAVVVSAAAAAAAAASVKMDTCSSSEDSMSGNASS